MLVALLLTLKAPCWLCKSSASSSTFVPRALDALASNLAMGKYAVVLLGVDIRCTAVFVTVTAPGSSSGSNLSIQQNPNGFGVWLIIAGTPGKTYQMQYTENLSPPAWVDERQVLMPAAGVVVVDEPPAGTRFYRTIIVGP